MAGTLFVVATPIGNLEDLSARAVATLREVSLIAAEDTRRTQHLLQRFGLTTRCTSFHQHNTKSKTGMLIERLLAGESIALVTDAGTPGISDPGHELVAAAREQGVGVVPIPGPSAVTAALSVCGFNADSFVFLGFPPTKGRERADWLERFKAASAVAPLVVFYEAPHRISETLSELGGLFGALPVVIGRELSKIHETFSVGRLTENVPGPALGEFVCVVEVGRQAGDDAPVPRPSAEQIGAEFGESTKSSGFTRRQAISALSRKYRLSAREVYALIEEAKISPV